MKRWLFPLQRHAVPSINFEGYTRLDLTTHTEIPLGPFHKGAFGYPRRHHTHEGVDMYCHEGTPVYAVEDGRVQRVVPFTGPQLNTSWWLNTDAVVVEGPSGMVVYGEIVPAVAYNDLVQTGDLIGRVTPVIPFREGLLRPRSMLHLELRIWLGEHDGTHDFLAGWKTDEPPPANLKDPTAFLLHTIPNLP